MSRKPSPPRQAAKSPRGGESVAGPEVQYVTSLSALTEICARIRDAGSFAFDTEFVMEDRYQPEVCLVQLATESLVAVVDPFEAADLSPVWSLVADPEVEVIVHAGMEDLALCQTQGGVTPQSVFDCQIACGLVSTDYPLSLSRMTRSLLGVRLHKSQTLTDWRRRPLSPEQIRYAADDVVHLPPVRRTLFQRLEQLGRKGWMEEEMTRFRAPATRVGDADETLLRLKGAGSLDGKGLAIARELVKARRELAAKYDRPARAVVRDHLIIEIARHRWTEASEIKSLRGLNLRTQGVRALAEAAQRASKLPKEQWPTTAPPDDETDQEAAATLLVGAVIRAHCAEHQIAHQLVGAKRDIRAYVRAHLRGRSPETPLTLEEGWRAETVGGVVREVVGGRAAVALRSDGQGLTVVAR